jgi:Ca2+-binding RTX toxin-like protein
MANIISYTPTGVIDKALFNFDAMGGGFFNFKLSGSVVVSISQPFIYSQYLAGSGNNLAWSPDVSSIFWNATQLANINSMLAMYKNFINLQFNSVVDYTAYNPLGVGLLTNSDINISFIYRNDLNWSGMSSINQNYFGYTGSSLDLILNEAKFGSVNYTLNNDTWGFHTAMHELGHSLGLSHPHSSYVNGVATLTADFSSTVNVGFQKLGFVINSASDMNKEYFSIMSYDDEKPSNGIDTYAQTPMILDVIALVDAYGSGSGTSGLGADTITPGGSLGVNSYRTYYDLGGNNTVNLENYSSGAFFNMGTTIIGANHLVGVSMAMTDYLTMSSAGNPTSLRWFYGEFQNAKGSLGNDYIVGNSLANTITGGGGNDIIDGGIGVDTAILNGLRSSYTVKATPNNSYTFIGGDGTDTFSNIELFQFADDTCGFNSSGALVDNFALVYVASYSDLLNAFHTDKAAALSHYINNGYSENRTASFDALAYVASYMDLINTFHTNKAEALTHYINTGYSEGRKISFNAADYLATYADLKTAFGNDMEAATQHYISFGFGEGRRPLQGTFIGTSGNDTIIGNAIANTIIAGSGNDTISGGAGNDSIDGGNGVDTAIFSGLRSGYTIKIIANKSCSVVGGDGTDTVNNVELFKFTDDTCGFNANGALIDNFALAYVASYADLLNAFHTDKASALTHYINNGYSENRTASFDALAYVASYMDLINTFHTNKAEALTHYINTGYSEGRKISFNAADYLATYADLKTAFGNDMEAATQHYISFGFGEGRRPLQGTFIGTNGNVTVTGGAGNDTFVFNTSPNVVTNLDTIIDFLSGVDKLQFNKSIFTALGTIGSSINAIEFYSAPGASSAIHSTDHFIYNNSNGALYYDPDGTGVSAAVEVAIIGITFHPSIMNTDIFVG